MAQVAHSRQRAFDRAPLFTQAGIAASGSAIGAAATAGVLAGLAMAALLIGHAAVTGAGGWLPVRNIAATWYGVSAFIGGAGVLAAGLLTHIIASAAWGAVLGLFVGRQRAAPTAAIIGLLYGVGVWAIMTFLVLTWTNRDMYARVMVHPWWWLGAHLLYGLLLGVLTPPLARAFSGVERDRPATAAEAASAPPSARQTSARADARRGRSDNRAQDDLSARRTAALEDTRPLH